VIVCISVTEVMYLRSTRNTNPVERSDVSQVQKKHEPLVRICALTGKHAYQQHTKLSKEEIRIKRIHSEELRKHGCTEDDTKIYQCFLYNIIFSVLWNRELFF
jgi:hypothetical protein